MTDTAKTKSAFLTEKAKNFRTWVETMSPDSDAQRWMSSFDEKLLLPTILTLLVPIGRAGKLDEVADQVLVKLTKVPEGQAPEVKAKLIRYLNMFIEVATK